MRDVLIALLPATVAAVVLHGLKALIMVVLCTAASVLSEFIFNLICKKKQTVGDLSAAVTGLLLALNLPVTATIWECIVGSVFAIIVVKCLFGGIGCNFANPAITARVFLLIAFSSTVGASANSYLQAGATHGFGELVEFSSGATPLAIIKTGEGLSALPSLTDMLLGLHGGAVGEGCSIALIIGFIYLVVRKVIHFETPVIFVGTVFVLTLLITGDPVIALYHVLSGGLLFAAIFMATDYVTTPITRSGRMLFALGCGIITVLIRVYGSYPEGVSFAILLMNICSPYLEKLTAKKAFGGNK